MCGWGVPPRAPVDAAKGCGSFPRMKSFSLILISSLLFAVACTKAPPPAPAAVTAAASTAGDPPLIPIGTKMKCPVFGDLFIVDEKM